MKTVAAVLVETGRPLELAELEIPPLRPGQVLVRVAFSGVCHTQLLECRGYRGVDRFLPHCLGHEGCGTVVEVGPDVTKARVGKKVILSWMKGLGRDVPGTTYAWDGRTVNAGGITTFSDCAVVSENRVTAVETCLSGAEAALLGCAIPTGMGAVLNTGDVKEGESVAVFGAGGIGLWSVAAASAAGCRPVVAIDTNEARLMAASQVGADRLVRADRENAGARLRELVPGGLDCAVEASGRPDVMRLALACVRPRGGRAVVVGNARHGEVLTIDPSELNQGKRLLGTWGGDNRPDTDFPRYARFFDEGRLKIPQGLVTEYDLARVNEALEALEAGRVGRAVLRMEGAESGGW
ncbi:MAG: zinc-binding dehydrogenase [Nitrospirae bacterium]|nr:zinc-binding dehydrogenase [Nitrospirota bacterium]